MGKASRKKVEQGVSSLKTFIRINQERGFSSYKIFLFLVILGVLIYSNSFSSPFLFDDLQNIVLNPRIKTLDWLPNLSGSRYFGFLSFSLNYQIGGLAVFGYHVVNVSIHIVNAFLIYLLICRLLRTPGLADSGIEVSRSNFWIAFFTAVIFLVHPIQTQAVTYIVQRFASLATFFYLLAVVGYLNWRLESPEKRIQFAWYGVALVSTILAMKTKEISFTLPLIILCIEVIFFHSLQKRSFLALVPFLLTLLIIPLSRIDAVSGADVGFAKETAEISRWDYLLTQFRVIVTYLRLLIFPIGQNLDYDYPIYHSLLQSVILFSFLLIASLLVFSLYCLFLSRQASRSARLIAFGILWFFLTLSIESSIIPIRDVIFEHRLYLPSIGFALCLCAIVIRGRSPTSSTPGRLCLGMLCLLLSFATYQRNETWRSEVAVWSDVIAKSPKKARGHNNLGFALYRSGQVSDSTPHYTEAIQLFPNYHEAHNNLGVSLESLGRTEEAITEYAEAVQIRPDYVEAHYNFGSALARVGRLEESVAHYSDALRFRPDDEKILHNLGEVLFRQGRVPEAVARGNVKSFVSVRMGCRLLADGFRK